MNIHFTRDSVCMGDDCYDNSQDFSFNDNATWEEIMPIIKTAHFLASVSGNNVVWVLTNSNKEEILSYYTLKDIIICHTKKFSLKEICGEKNTLHFKYYPTLQKRGEYISKINKDIPYNMWKDYWIKEHTLCMR